MAILYDARGNEIRCWFPDSVNNETITDARPSTNNFTAAAQEILIDLNGACNVAVDLRAAAASLTVVFEATIDGTNYVALPAFAIAQNLAGTLVAEQYVPSVVVATTTASSYLVSVTGFRRFRLRCSVWASGSVTCACRVTQSDEFIYTRPIPSTLHVTVTAAVNTAATITLPAAGLDCSTISPGCIPRVLLLRLLWELGRLSPRQPTCLEVPRGPAVTRSRSVTVELISTINRPFR